MMYKYNLEKAAKEESKIVKGFAILAVVMFIIGWMLGSLPK